MEGLLSSLPSFPGHKAKAVAAGRPGPSQEDQKAPDWLSVTCEGLNSTNTAPSPCSHTAVVFVPRDASVCCSWVGFLQLPVLHPMGRGE